MKNYLRLFCFLIMVLSVTSISFADVDSSLVGYWNFDDCTLNDSSENSHTGIFIGAPTCVSNGIVGNAFYFDGVTNPEYIYVPNSSLLSFDDNFTVSLWFNIQSYTSMDGYLRINEFGDHALFSKSGDRNGLSIRTTRDHDDGLLRIWALNGRCCGYDHIQLKTSTGYVVDEWHMISFTHGNGEVKLYFDGVLEDSMSSSEYNLNPLISSQIIQFGMGQTSFWYPLDGILDDIRVYNRTLSDDEIQGLFQNAGIVDSDSDGIPDDEDNCPDVDNPNQFDNDADSFGDVCDDDDDNDGISDIDDNCQYDVNSDQADHDGDGYGNVCDTDDDNDGILDATDQCVFTVPGEVVNDTGCSIADLCMCDNPWKNHGAYVRCVAHTSEDFISAGLITEVEKDSIVSGAAESICGHKN